MKLRDLVLLLIACCVPSSTLGANILSTQVNSSAVLLQNSYSCNRDCIAEFTFYNPLTTTLNMTFVNVTINYLNGSVSPYKANWGVVIPGTCTNYTSANSTPTWWCTDASVNTTLLPSKNNTIKIWTYNKPWNIALDWNILIDVPVNTSTNVSFDSHWKNWANWNNVSNAFNLVVYYNFDNNTHNNTKVFDYLNATNGSINLSITQNVTGYLNNSFNFTNVESNVNISALNSSIPTAFATIPFGFSFWATNGTSQNYFLTKASTVNGQKFMYLFRYANGSFEIACFWNNGTGLVGVSNQTMNTSWNFIVGTYDKNSKSILMYMSNSSGSMNLVINKTANTACESLNNSPLYIHRRGGNDGVTNMAMDEFAWYNQTLNSSQVTDLYNGCYNLSNNRTGADCVIYGTNNLGSSNIVAVIAPIIVKNVIGFVDNVKLLFSNAIGTVIFNE